MALSIDLLSNCPSFISLNTLFWSIRNIYFLLGIRKFHLVDIDCRNLSWIISEVYWEPCQISMMDSAILAKRFHYRCLTEFSGTPRYLHRDIILNIYIIQVIYKQYIIHGVLYLYVLHGFCSTRRTRFKFSYCYFAMSRKCCSLITHYILW